MTLNPVNDALKRSQGLLLTIVAIDMDAHQALSRS